MIRPSVFTNWCLLKLGSSPPKDTERQAHNFSDDSFSEGKLPSCGETHFCYKTGKSLGEDLHPKGRERIYKIYDSKFSKLMF